MLTAPRALGTVCEKRSSADRAFTAQFDISPITYLRWWNTLVNSFSKVINPATKFLYDEQELLRVTATFEPSMNNPANDPV